MSVYITSFVHSTNDWYSSYCPSGVRTIKIYETIESKGYTAPNEQIFLFSKYFYIVLIIFPPFLPHLKFVLGQLVKVNKLVQDI